MTLDQSRHPGRRGRTMTTPVRIQRRRTRGYRDAKCGRCGKRRGDHKAVTLECPYGLRDRSGGYSFGRERFVDKTLANAAPKRRGTT
jgi:hypothetical protein